MHCNWLKLCIEKRQVKTFSRSLAPIHYSYDIHGSSIKRTDHVKVLGVVLDTKFQFNRDTEEVISRILLLGFVLRMTPNDSLYSPYETRLLLLGLQPLKDRLRIAYQLFVAGLWTGYIDCPTLLQQLDLYAPTVPLRPRPLLAIGCRRINYGSGEPLTSMCRSYKEVRFQHITTRLC